MDPELIRLFAMILGPGGAVYVGFKAGMNGLREDVKDIRVTQRETRDEVKGLRRDMSDVRERVAGIEAVTEEVG